MKKDTSQIGDEAGYIPNWINMDTKDLPDDDDLPLDDDDFELMIDPDEDLDYKNKEKIRF